MNISIFNLKKTYLFKRQTNEVFKINNINCIDVKLVAGE